MNTTFKLYFTHAIFKYLHLLQIFKLYIQTVLLDATVMQVTK